MEAAASSSSSSALVIWGSTGKRLQFTRQELQMPESVKSKSNYHFFEKQWDTVAGFWMNRVLKEASLQHMTVENIVQCIVNDIERRWEQRKKEKTLYKKKKRLLDRQNITAAGMPSPHVLLTNFVSLNTYRELIATDKFQELVLSVIEKVEELAKEKVIRHTILVDDSEGNNNDNHNNNGNNSQVGTEKNEDQNKKRKLEEGSELTFDDHVAIVCTLSSEVRAASVVAELHGSKFDSRVVMCRFYDL
ncbi:uncharacterized protein TM35_000202530 [Trypanosoma theileri]|uniref:Uncharacterized protein n=1 Tax=Trypanosoma theileri TaxID=67003 RepID=A0A1X0NT13_9TRYP|nr:uncharacterized protein TM35_000202530 [Trypanosoma theileri]ORC87844.1 hypothetical protein TM35_000202530 [Trypanosoma theileri]